MIIKPKNPQDLSKFLKSKRLILFGMGDTGIRISKWCDNNGIDYLFSDKRALELRKTTNKFILSPECLKNEYQDANIIISSIVYYKEIMEDLLKLGIDNERIFSYLLFMPDKVSWEEIEDNRLADWTLMHKRYEMISSWGWISQKVDSLADYGAGRKFIKEFLPVTTKYYPIDFLDRGENTLICDFNKEEFPNVYSETSVCTGVLMYIIYAEKLVNHICSHTENTIIFSYVTLEGFADIEARRRSSMINDYTEKEIINMFNFCGFNLINIKYDISGNTTMTLFLFKKGGILL